MPLTAVTACVSILAFLHIVTKSQAIKTSFISFQNVSSFSGILNKIARCRIMHVSTKDTFENGEVGVDYEIWHVPMLR